VGIRSSFRTVSVHYRNTARIFVVSFIFLSLFAPLLVNGQAQNPSPWGLKVTDVNCSSTGTFFGTAYYEADANITVTGNQYVNAQVALSVAVTWYDQNQKPILSAVPPNTGSAWSFDHNPLDWPSQQSTTFGVLITEYGYSWPDSYSCQGWVALSVNGVQYANVTFGSVANSATFQLLVALPLFNDTSFGDTAHCPISLNPCQVPVGDFYNFVAGIALGLAVIGFMISYASSSMQGKDRIPFVDLTIAIFFILAFPYIYNQVATLIDYLNMALVAGPGNDFTKYAANINEIWVATGASAQSGIWGFLTNPLVQLAAWVVDFIVYIGSFILGTIRILLIAVMIVAFPISLALKEVPFTRKLGQMVEDTLFGLMLASIMSSIVLGLAAYILGSGTGGTVFQGSDIWFAAISLLTALLLPTVFAPLTGVMFQTGMQAAMAAGTAAVLAGTGGAMGAVGGVQAMGQATNMAGGVAGSVGRSSGSIGTHLASSMQGSSSFGSAGLGTLHGLKGVGAGLAMGMFTGMGMRPVAWFARSEIKTPGQIVQGHSRALQQASHAAQFMHMQEEAAVVAPDLAGHAENVVNVGLSGRTLDFSHVTNSSGQHFRVTRWFDPKTGVADYNAASKWRDNMLELSTNPNKLGQELASHHLIPAEMATNQLLAENLGRQLHARLSAIDPKTDAGVRALQNLKNTVDANQFRGS
jgi:hypothetical protein